MHVCIASPSLRRQTLFNAHQRVRFKVHPIIKIRVRGVATCLLHAVWKFSCVVRYALRKAAMNGQKSAGAQPDPHGESYRSFAQDGMERENEEEEEVEGEQLRESSSGVPIQWPLFESPTMTTIRVTSYTDRQGTIVSQ